MVLSIFKIKYREAWDRTSRHSRKRRKRKTMLKLGRRNFLSVPLTRYRLFLVAGIVSFALLIKTIMGSEGLYLDVAVSFYFLQDFKMSTLTEQYLAVDSVINPSFVRDLVLHRHRRNYKLLKLLKDDNTFYFHSLK